MPLKIAFAKHDWFKSYGDEIGGLENGWISRSWILHGDGLLLTGLPQLIYVALTCLFERERQRCEYI